MTFSPPFCSTVHTFILSIHHSAGSTRTHWFWLRTFCGWTVLFYYCLGHILLFTLITVVVSHSHAVILQFFPVNSDSTLRTHLIYVYRFVTFTLIYCTCYHHTFLRLHGLYVTARLPLPDTPLRFTWVHLLQTCTVLRLYTYTHFLFTGSTAFSFTHVTVWILRCNYCYIVPGWFGRCSHSHYTIHLFLFLPTTTADTNLLFWSHWLSVITIPLVPYIWTICYCCLLLFSDLFYCIWHSDLLLWYLNFGYLLLVRYVVIVQWLLFILHWLYTCSQFFTIFVFVFVTLFWTPCGDCCCDWLHISILRIHPFSPHHHIDCWLDWTRFHIPHTFILIIQFTTLFIPILLGYFHLFLFVIFVISTTRSFYFPDGPLLQLYTFPTDSGHSYSYHLIEFRFVPYIVVLMFWRPILTRFPTYHTPLPQFVPTHIYIYSRCSICCYFTAPRSTKCITTDLQLFRSTILIPDSTTVRYSPLLCVPTFISDSQFYLQVGPTILFWTFWFTFCYLHARCYLFTNYFVNVIWFCSHLLLLITVVILRLLHHIPQLILHITGSLHVLPHTLRYLLLVVYFWVTFVGAPPALFIAPFLVFTYVWFTVVRTFTPWIWTCVHHTLPARSCGCVLTTVHVPTHHRLFHVSTLLVGSPRTTTLPLHVRTFTWDPRVLRCYHRFRRLLPAPAVPHYTTFIFHHHGSHWTLVTFCSRGSATHTIFCMISPPRLFTFILIPILFPFVVVHTSFCLPPFYICYNPILRTIHRTWPHCSFLQVIYILPQFGLDCPLPTISTFLVGVPICWFHATLHLHSDHRWGPFTPVYILVHTTLHTFVGWPTHICPIPSILHLCPHSWPFPPFTAGLRTYVLFPFTYTHPHLHRSTYRYRLLDICCGRTTFYGLFTVVHYIRWDVPFGYDSLVVVVGFVWFRTCSRLCSPPQLHSCSARLHTTYRSCLDGLDVYLRPTDTPPLPATALSGTLHAFTWLPFARTYLHHAAPDFRLFTLPFYQFGSAFAPPLLCLFYCLRHWDIFTATCAHTWFTTTCCYCTTFYFRLYDFLHGYGYHCMHLHCTPAVPTVTTTAFLLLRYSWLLHGLVLPAPFSLRTGPFLDFTHCWVYTVLQLDYLQTPPLPSFTHTITHTARIYLRIRFTHYTTVVVGVGFWFHTPQFTTLPGPYHRLYISYTVVPHSSAFPHWFTQFLDSFLFTLHSGHTVTPFWLLPYVTDTGPTVVHRIPTAPLPFYYVHIFTLYYHVWYHILPFSLPHYVSYSCWTTTGGIPTHFYIHSHCYLLFQFTLYLQTICVHSYIPILPIHTTPLFYLHTTTFLTTTYNLTVFTTHSHSVPDFLILQWVFC